MMKQILQQALSTQSSCNAKSPLRRMLFTLLLVTIGVGSASAQFEKGKYYLGATTNMAGLAYSKNEKVNFNAGINAGYMMEQDWLMILEAGFNYRNSDMQSFYAGAKCRYFFEQNGVFLQLGGKYQHYIPNFNDVLITPEVGYCFFLNRHLTIEPSLYYDISLKDYSEYSKVGLKVGLAWYF